MGMGTERSSSDLCLWVAFFKRQLSPDSSVRSLYPIQHTPGRPVGLDLQSLWASLTNNLGDGVVIAECHCAAASASDKRTLAIGSKTLPWNLEYGVAITRIAVLWGSFLRAGRFEAKAFVGYYPCRSRV